MDSTQPIAKRTRRREAELYRELYEELRRKKEGLSFGVAAESKRKCPEATNSGGLGRVKEGDATGSSRKGNESGNLGFDDGGGVDDDYLVFLDVCEKGGDLARRGFDFIDNGDGFDGSEVGESNGMNFETSKSDFDGKKSRGLEMDESCNGFKSLREESGGVEISQNRVMDESCSGFDYDFSIRKCGGSRLKFQDNDEGIRAGDDHFDVCDISEDDSEELEVFSSDEGEEENDDHKEDERKGVSSSDDHHDHYDVSDDDSDELVTISSEGDDEEDYDDDDDDDDDYEGEQVEGYIMVEDLSSEEEALEREERGKGEKDDSRLRIEKKLGEGSLFDLINRKDGDINDDSVDTSNSSGDFNCVAKRTRSHHNSESANKRMKLGTVRHPVCIDEDLGDGNVDGADASKTNKSDQRTMSKKGRIGSRECNGDVVESNEAFDTGLITTSQKGKIGSKEKSSDELNGDNVENNEAFDTSLTTTSREGKIGFKEKSGDDFIGHNVENNEAFDTGLTTSFWKGKVSLKKKSGNDFNSDNVDNDEAFDIGLTTTSQKGKINFKEKSSDDCLQNLCEGQPSKRKRIHAYKEHEIVNVLVDSILDNSELPCQRKKDVVIEPTLPLKFTFGIEESTPMEKLEEEKELEELWAEMALALCENDGIDSKTCAENEADITEIELETATYCHRGDHWFIVDEEIGIKCKYCSFVDLEIKYCVPPFSKHSWGRSGRKDPQEKEQNLFEHLNFHDSCNDSQSGSDPCYRAQGTVWDIIPGIGKDMHAHQREGFEFLWKNIAGGIHLDKLKEATSDNGGSGCVISHAPGTGKTRLAIVFLQTYLKLYPTCRPVIIAPCSMLLTWEAEFRKWKVDVPFHNLNNPDFSGKENMAALGTVKGQIGNFGPKHVRAVKLYSWAKDRSILGLSYGLFEKLVGKDRNEDGETLKGKNKDQKVKNDVQTRKVLLEFPDLLFLDEGHTARNKQSLIWKALSNIRTEKKIILSGTPFQNNFDELFNTLWLVRPRFADMISFKRHGVHVKRRGRKKSEARENWASLTDPIGKVNDGRLKAKILAQLRAVIGPFVHIHRGNILQERLPGLRDSVIILEPADLQKDLLDTIQGMKNLHNFDFESLLAPVSVHPSLLSDVFEKKGKKCHPSDLVFKLKDLLNQKDELERKLKECRLNSEAGIKTKFLMELIRLCNARNERVIIFGQYIDPLELIREQLEYQFNWTTDRDILFMDGKVDIKLRQSFINDFNDPKSEAKVMLASIKACSEGINLVGASRVVLMDVVWNPSVERQAISRAYRLGQEKMVYIYHLITSATMEEEKYCRQVEKERLSELVFFSADGAGGHQKTPSNFSDNTKDQVLELMVEREKMKDIFKKIIYQPKDSNLVESFGFLDLE